MGTEDQAMETDLRGRVVALEQKYLGFEPRITLIEAWQRQMDIFNARKDEQFKNLTDRFDSLDKKIDSVNTHLSADMEKVNETLTWLARLIIGALISGVAAGAVSILFKLSP